MNNESNVGANLRVCPVIKDIKATNDGVIATTNAGIVSAAKQSVTTNAFIVRDCFVAALLSMTALGNAMTALGNTMTGKRNVITALIRNVFVLLRPLQLLIINYKLLIDYALSGLRNERTIHYTGRCPVLMMYGFQPLYKFATTVKEEAMTEHAMIEHAGQTHGFAPTLKL
jgi:hypothetical protein